MAIYTNDHGDKGASYAGFGMVDALHLNAANVVEGTDKATMLHYVTAGLLIVIAARAAESPRS